MRPPCVIKDRSHFSSKDIFDDQFFLKDGTLILSLHADVDMGQERMKLGVSFDKSDFPDPLIKPNALRVIYAFFVASRSQSVIACIGACHILI